MTADRDPDPDVLWQLHRDLQAAREALTRAVDVADALSDLAGAADGVAGALGQVTLTPQELLDGAGDELARARLLALSARAYGPTTTTKEAA